MLWDNPANPESPGLLRYKPGNDTENARLCCGMAGRKAIGNAPPCVAE